MVGNASGCFKKWYNCYFLAARNFFTDLRKASVYIPKPQLASSIANLQTTFFLHFLFKKKKLGEGTSTPRSKVTLLFSLSCSVDFFMLSPHNKPAFLALIPPSFTSLNPFVTFFRPLQPHSSNHSWGKYENSRFNSDAFSYIWKMQSRETSRAYDIKSPLNEWKKFPYGIE